jgi:hypothetical protein
MAVREIMPRYPNSNEYIGLEASVDPGTGYPNTLALPGPNVGYPGLPSQSLIVADPENQWQAWAQDFVDWEDNQTDMANTRLPYASTLLQLDESRGNYHIADEDIGVKIVDSILAETPKNKEIDPLDQIDTLEDYGLDYHLV